MIKFFSDFQKGSSVELSFYATKVTLCYSDDRKKKSKTGWECLGFLCYSSVVLCYSWQFIEITHDPLRFHRIIVEMKCIFKSFQNKTKWNFRMKLIDSWLTLIQKKLISFSLWSLSISFWCINQLNLLNYGNWLTLTWFHILQKEK